MTDYKQVAEALKKGTDPDNLCMTCPWDRFCIMPPAMSSADIEDKIKEAQVKDNEKDPDHKGLPFGMMLTALLVAGKDVTSEVCPVLSLRLRTQAGRVISDSLKGVMKGIHDEY